MSALRTTVGAPTAEVGLLPWQRAFSFFSFTLQRNLPQHFRTGILCSTALLNMLEVVVNRDRCVKNDGC